MSSRETFLEAMENWVNVYLYRSLSEYFEFLKMTDVSMQQAYVLTFIHYNGPCKMSEICEHMMVSAAAASQMVNRLENQGLVERIAAPKDRRVRQVELSEKGELLVLQSIAARQGWIQEIPDKLNKVQLDQISAALQLLSSIYQETTNYTQH
jgi:DNA-binding MarR family transcriptional regulator